MEDIDGNFQQALDLGACEIPVLHDCVLNNIQHVILAKIQARLHQSS